MPRHGHQRRPSHDGIGKLQVQGAAAYAIAGGAAPAKGVTAGGVGQASMAADRCWVELAMEARSPKSSRAREPSTSDVDAGNHHAVGEECATGLAMRAIQNLQRTRSGRPGEQSPGQVVASRCPPRTPCVWCGGKTPRTYSARGKAQYSSQSQATCKIICCFTSGRSLGSFVRCTGSQLLPLDVWDDLHLLGILQSKVFVGGAGR